MIFVIDRLNELVSTRSGLWHEPIRVQFGLRIVVHWIGIRIVKRIAKLY